MLANAAPVLWVKKQRGASPFFKVQKMGYQVGRICYRTDKEATDVAMSQVVPSFDKDGNLNLPQYNGRDWVYRQQIRRIWRVCGKDACRSIRNNLCNYRPFKGN